MRVLAFLLAFFICLVRTASLSIHSVPIAKLANKAAVKNMLTGSFLVAAGDIISQNIEIRRSKGHIGEKKYSPTRSLQWAAFGVFVNGMVCYTHPFHFGCVFFPLMMNLYAMYWSPSQWWFQFLSWWFKFLAQLVPLRQGNIMDVIKKVAVNQFFLAPGLNAIIFLFSILTAKDALTLSEKLNKFFLKCRKDLPSTMSRSTM